MHGVEKCRSSGEYHHRLYWAHALIRHYLTTGRKYVLIKKYAHNKHVRLLIRLYGSYPVSFYSGEEAAAVESLRKKMMTNLDNARDRVNFLCKRCLSHIDV